MTYVNLQDVDLDELKNDLTANGTQYDVWYMNLISKYNELKQKDLLLRRRPGSCKFTFVYTLSNRTIGVVLLLDSNNTMLRKLPVTEESNDIPFVMNDITGFLNSGDIEGLRKWILATVLAAENS